MYNISKQGPFLGVFPPWLLNYPTYMNVLHALWLTGCLCPCRCVCQQSGVDAEPNGSRTKSGEWSRQISSVSEMLFSNFINPPSPRALWVTLPAVSRRWSTGTWQEHTSRRSRLKVRTWMFLSICLSEIWLCLFSCQQLTENIQT